MFTIYLNNALSIYFHQLELMKHNLYLNGLGKQVVCSYLIFTFCHLKVHFSFSKNHSHALLDFNKPPDVIYMTEYNTTYKILIFQVICLRPKGSSVAITKYINWIGYFIFYMAETLLFAIKFLFWCLIYWRKKYEITNWTHIHVKNYLLRLYNVKSLPCTINGCCSLSLFI